MMNHSQKILVTSAKFGDIMVKDLTRFERARIVGARALQISEGAPPLIKTEKIRPLDIAKEEMEKKVIPIGVRRKGKGY